MPRARQKGAGSCALLQLALLVTAAAVCAAAGKGVKVASGSPSAKGQGQGQGQVATNAQNQPWSHGVGKPEQAFWLKKLGMALWASDIEAARASFAATKTLYEKKRDEHGEAVLASEAADAQIAKLKKDMDAVVAANAMISADIIKKKLLAAEATARKLDADLKTKQSAYNAAEKDYESEGRQLESLEAAVSSLEFLAAKARLLITEVRLRLAHMNAKHSKSATEFLDSLTWQKQESILKTEKKALMARYKLPDPALALEAKMADTSNRRTRALGSADAYRAEFDELHDVLWAYIGKSAKGHRLTKQRNRPFWLTRFELKTESQELDKLAAQTQKAERDLNDKEYQVAAKQKAYVSAEQKHWDLRAKEKQAGLGGHYSKAAALKKKVADAGDAVNKARAELNEALAQVTAADTTRTLYSKGLVDYGELLEVVERVCARFTKDALQETIAVSEAALPEAVRSESWALANKLKAANKASTKILDDLMKAYIFADTTGEMALPDGRNSEL